MAWTVQHRLHGMARGWHTSMSASWSSLASTPDSTCGNMSHAACPCVTQSGALQGDSLSSKLRSHHPTRIDRQARSAHSTAGRATCFAFSSIFAMEDSLVVSTSDREHTSISQPEQPYVDVLKCNSTAAPRRRHDDTSARNHKSITVCDHRAVDVHVARCCGVVEARGRHEDRFLLRHLNPSDRRPIPRALYTANEPHRLAFTMVDTAACRRRGSESGTRTHTNLIVDQQLACGCNLSRGLGAQES